MIIDHVNLPVSDLDRSKQFYDAVLLTLGYRVVAEDGPAVGYGRNAWHFGIEQLDQGFPALHLAFAAPSREQVDAFYQAALAHGAMSNGAPGDRPLYGDRYYAAFVNDPDGHNIEAVFRG